MWSWSCPAEVGGGGLTLHVLHPVRTFGLLALFRRAEASEVENEGGLRCGSAPLGTPVKGIARPLVSGPTVWSIYVGGTASREGIATVKA